MNNRYPQTQGMNSPPGIPGDYQYGLTPIPTSSPLYPCGVGFAPNISASPYPTAAFISGNPSNSSYPAASSSYLLVPNNPYLVFISSYPASTSQYPASSNSAYPASTSAFPTSSNSCYPASCNSPHLAPTSAYPSSSNGQYPASTSSYLATSYPTPASTNQSPSPSPYPLMGSRTYDSKFRPSIMNNRYPQTPGMNSPPGIPEDYPYGPPTPMLTSNPLYTCGVGFAPNMSVSPYPPAAFTSDKPSNSSCPAASSSYLLVPNNPYLVFTSPYPASFNNPYPASTSNYPASSNSAYPAASSSYLLEPNNPYLVFTSPYPASFNNPYPASTSNYPASSNSAYPASASGFPTSSNNCYPTSCNSPNPAPTSACPSSSKVHYPASTSSYLTSTYLAPASTNHPLSASPHPPMESRAYDSKFGPSVNETNDDAFNINALPNEIILEVFGYLTQNQMGQIARVCRRWNVLTKSPVLWKNVDVIFSPLHRSQTTVAISFIKGLPSCSTSIRLDFSNWEAWYAPLNFAELCLKLQEKCPHLEQLILIHSEISNSFCSVIHLCNQFLQDIKNLIFHYSQFCCYRPVDECFGISKIKYRPVGECLGTSKIKIVELFKCYMGCSSTSPFSKMPHLEQLHLYSTSLGFSWFKDITYFLHQLHVLNMGGTKITAGTFQEIRNHFHNLKELYLCSSILQDRDLNFNKSTFPQLKIICLYCTRVTCEGVVSLIQSCPSLQNVYVSEHVAASFAAHPFVVANRCKSGIVKAIEWLHDHNVDYSPF